MERPALRCNACWNVELEEKGQCVATACSHLFCLTCAQQIVENGSDGAASCPVCDGLITKSNIKIITRKSTTEFTLGLCGQDPETAMAAALSSVQFYVNQQLTTAQKIQGSLEGRCKKMEAACKKKLEQVHNGYMQAKRKYEEAMQANQQMQQEKKELQDKYAQRSMQARKLQEMLQKMKQENDGLRRGSGKSNAAASVASGRSLSPGQVVTTMHRTQVYTTAVEPPMAMGHGLHQALVPTGQQRSGNIMMGGFRASGQGQPSGYPTQQLSPARQPGGKLFGNAAMLPTSAVKGGTLQHFMGGTQQHPATGIPQRQMGGGMAAFPTNNMNNLGVFSM